eukprot:189765_1
MNTILSEISLLSVWVYCWFGSLAILWLLSFIWMWQFSLCSLLFMVPFFLFIRWWYINRVHCSLNHVLKPFLHGYVNITLLAIFGQFIGLVIVSSIFVATDIMFHRAGYLFYVLTSITLYVFLEEILKLFFNLKARDAVIDPIRQINKSHTLTSTATALGYSMCTGMLWTAFAAYELKNGDAKDHEQYNLFGWLFLITLIIAVIGMPMHLITGYLTGCKITQKDLQYSRSNPQNEMESDNHRMPFTSYIKVIVYPTFVRTAYLFFLIVGFLVFQFSIGGVIVALFGIILDYVLLIQHTKRIESNLPFDYLQRAGQLSIFGYNVLQDAPESQDDDELQHPIPITAVSLDCYGVNLDDNMVIPKSNEVEVSPDPQMQYKQENDNVENGSDKEVHVSSAILTDSD